MKEKGTFYIGELSELFDISVDSIRYYDNTLNLSMQYHVNGGTDWDYLMAITETAE